MRIRQNIPQLGFRYRVRRFLRSSGESWKQFASSPIRYIVSSQQGSAVVSMGY